MNHPLPEITLRALEPDDLDFLYDIENDRQLWDVGATNVPYSRSVLTEYIVNNAADIYTDKQVRLVMQNSNGERVGLLDIFNFDPRHARAEIGVVVAKPFRRNGYAAAALKQALHYSKQICHLNQVYALVDCQNIPSRALFEKVGFVHTADLKKWLQKDDFFCDAWMMQFFL